MKNLSVRMKMILMAVITLLGLLAVGVFSMRQVFLMESTAEAILRQSIEEDYDTNIRNQVENAISLLEAEYAKYEAGECTLEEAKKQGADMLRELRYGEAGYFWADTYEGDNVVLLGSDTEGTNRMETEDAAGYQMVKNIIKVGQEPEGGFTDYVFPREGETESSPKRSYSKSYEPFGWVIGTGNYIDYIDSAVEEQTSEMQQKAVGTLKGIVGISGVLILVIMGFCIYMAGNLSRSFKVALEYIGHIAGGDFTCQLPRQLFNRKDDFGILGRQLEDMKHQVSALIKEVKNQGIIINDVVDAVKDNVFVLSGNIEDVSATTQELAASMEETAASSETIKNMSHEIELAAKNIANRSQDGAEQAASIHERASEARDKAKVQREHARQMNNEIRESLTRALKEAEVVQQIEVLSSAIMDITNQTNLLALNASIEAARAGDAGKGFAVVATEIGGLAEQSKQTVTKIQSVTEKVTAAVRNLSEDAEHLLEFVGNDVVESYDMFDAVASAYNRDAEDIDALISDFSATSEELLASIDGVLEAMDGIADATNEGAKGTTDIASKTCDVKSRTDTVSGEVERCNDTAKRLNEEISLFVVE